MMGITLFSYDLVNKNGVVVGVLPFGASIQRILIPDKNGGTVDVVQGYDTVEGYEQDKVYYGGIVGRFANRIANASFTLDNHEYKLPSNRPGVCLHGGNKGFNKNLWSVVNCADQCENSITLELTSQDGDEGFPGEVTARVTYSLNDENELHLRYTATTTKPTVINLTNHSYFNLAGHSASTMLDHELQVFADKYLPKGTNNCPTGEMLDCTAAFDFKNPTKLKDRINAYLPADSGIDHSFLVKNWKKGKGCNDCRPLLPAAKVVDPVSGRWLLVSTNDCVCHIYTGNFLDNIHGKEGAVYQKHSALCFETHGCPNAPNIPSFPSTVLRPGELYSHHTVWKFGGF